VSTESTDLDLQPGYRTYADDGNFGPLIVAPDPGIAVQQEAEEKLPLGFCNSCVARVKAAFLAGEPEGEPVRAAVTLVPHQQAVRIPGQLPGQYQTAHVVLAMPSCWECIVMTEAPSQLMVS
jgi:hypothetical protein